MYGVLTIAFWYLLKTTMMWKHQNVQITRHKARHSPQLRYYIKNHGFSILGLKNCLRSHFMITNSSIQQKPRPWEFKNNFLRSLQYLYQITLRRWICCSESAWHSNVKISIHIISSLNLLTCLKAIILEVENCLCNL